MIKMLLPVVGLEKTNIDFISLVFTGLFLFSWVNSWVNYSESSKILSPRQGSI